MTADIAAAFAGQAAAGGEAIGIGADLHVTLGRLVSALEYQREMDLARVREISVAMIPAHSVALAAGAGTLDIADELGPHEGQCWAVHWVTAAGFSAGTVSVYWGLPDLAAGSNLRFVFTSAGVWEPPRTSTLLQARDRMVFVAAGITGSVVISGQVTQMTARMLPRFLA